MSQLSTNITAPSLFTEKNTESNANLKLDPAVILPKVRCQQMTMLKDSAPLNLSKLILLLEQLLLTQG